MLAPKPRELRGALVRLQYMSGPTSWCRGSCR